jgi:uncharacterized membrane protein YkvA (DUF1232 family)
MGTRLTRWLSFPTVARSVVRNIRLAVRLLREPRVPVLLKAIPLLGLAYVIWPLDAIPDLIPAIGELDDLTLIILAIEAFKRLCPTVAVAHHEAAIASGQRYAPMTAPAPGDYIDAQFRHE